MACIIMLALHMHVVHIIGMTLDQYLSAESLSEAAFGLRVGLSQSQVNRIRNGLSRPSLKMALRIAEETKQKVPADVWAEKAGAA